MAAVDVETRLARWREAWPKALACWSRYTRLHDPRLCDSRLEAAAQGLSGSFAMIRLFDQSVVIDLETVAKLQLDDCALEILAHEIGHHVLAPATVTDQFRLLARMRRALPTLEAQAPLMANLFTDLYINDRLQRRAGLRMDEIYRRLARHAAAQGQPQGDVWTLYMGIYESLWQLPRGSLGGPTEDATLLGDAWLGARLVRVYADDWLHAAGRFATLLLPYLVAEREGKSVLGFLHDTRLAAEHADPRGGLEVEPEEVEGSLHPSEDPGITGAARLPVEAAPQAPQASGQLREPYEYGEILKASGIQLSDHEIAVRYYRERALPDLVPFPVRRRRAAPEPLPEGLEPWEAGDPLDELDWLQTLLQSPIVVPGVTTVRRVQGEQPGRELERVPVDLDVYVDSSGSMPNPQQRVSYLTLAGAIVALSALRSGSRVQVTLWSGKNQVTRTDGFVRDEDGILSALTGFYGGGTCFPLHCLRETFARRGAGERPVHLLMISDDGITTLFDNDEQGHAGWDIVAMALAKGRAGGTMALNVPLNWQQSRWSEPLLRAQAQQDWLIQPVPRMEELLDFAREFSRRHYQNDREVTSP